MQMFRANLMWYVVVDGQHVGVWRDGRRSGNFSKGRRSRANSPSSIHGAENVAKMGGLTWFF